jgi:hypothetical protein
MTDARAAVADFLKEFSATNTPLSGDADIFDSLGITGDDASEFIERFVNKFEIDAANYRWYFHHGEEPMLNIGGLFFKPPYRRVDRIPITPQILAEAIRAKRWPLEYPEHRLPRVRWDIRLSQAFLLAMLALFVALFVAKLWRGFTR